MDRYSEYLAINVLNEERVINYRLLSRALKVHSNVAKQMLFDFYQKQNKKKKGTVHATYLLAGKQRQMQAMQTNGLHSQDAEGDTHMPSSPFPSSSAPQPKDHEEPEAQHVTLISIVKEEHLEQAKALLDQIESIHIYSIGPGPVKDLHVLTDCNRRVNADFREDPLQTGKIYGTIQNPNVTRRTLNRQPPAPVAVPAPASKTAPKPAVEPKKEPAKPIAKPKREDSTDSTVAAPKADKETSDSSAPSDAKKPATLKRDSSSIFKSFAKAKPKSVKPGSTQSSASASPAVEPVSAMSDDEADEGSMMLDEEPTTEKEPSGKSRIDRKAELEKMMDAEDEVMEDVETPKTGGEGNEEAEDEEPNAIDQVEKEEPKEEVTVTNGRRRGRRRVMKKRTMKDEDGYLVTKEEAAWESFSEDEPEPAAKKVKMPTTTNVPAKGAAAAKKKGQGNIMSFFAKK